MAELVDFDRIRELCLDYSQQRITKQEYRKQRTIILSRIDKEINSKCTNDGQINSAIKVVEKMMSFFKKTDEEKII